MKGVFREVSHFLLSEARGICPTAFHLNHRSPRSSEVMCMFHTDLHEGYMQGSQRKGNTMIDPPFKMGSSHSNGELGVMVHNGSSSCLEFRTH